MDHGVRGKGNDEKLKGARLNANVKCCHDVMTSQALNGRVSAE